MTTPPSPPNHSQGKKRFYLVLLALLFAAPWVVAWYLYFIDTDWFESVSTGNYGTFITPMRAAPDTTFTDLDDQPHAFSTYKDKWTFIQTLEGACTDDCQLDLYKLRQIRLAVAEDRYQIERVLVANNVPDTDALRQTLTEYPGVNVLAGPDSTLQSLNEWLGADAEESRIFLIDPHSRLMMRYPKDADPIKLLRDLQILLKQKIH